MMFFRRIYYKTKAALKRRTTWAVILTAVFLFFVYRGVTLPDPDNTVVGILGNGTGEASLILTRLSGKDGIFRFEEYDDEEELRDDILSGKLECGFIFDPNFDILVESGKMKKGIRYIRSPYTTKGAVAKEVLYGELLWDVSAGILSEDADEIFTATDPSEKDLIRKSILDRNEYYRNGSEIFAVRFEEEP